MPTFGALCFHSRQAIEADNQFSNTFGDRVYTAWHDPVGIDYVRADADDLHIATQYGTLPQDVPIRVFLCYVAGECETSHPIRQDWQAFVRMHGVKGHVSTTTAAVVADLMRTLRRAVMDGPLLTDESINSYRLAQGRDPLMTVAPPDGMMDERIGATDVTWRQVFEGLDPDVQVHVVDSRTGYRPTPTGTAAAGIEPTRENSFLTYRRNRELHGNMVTRRQQESAAARARDLQRSIWVIDWQATETWTCPGPDGEPVHWVHSQLEMKHLWDTICWCVTNVVNLFNQYHNQPGDTLRILAAKRWLSAQPAFRALVQEAIRRRMTFPKDVFQFLRNYLLPPETTEIAVSPPWADPAASYQNDALAAFADAPLQIPEEVNPLVEFGRDFRDITID